MDVKARGIGRYLNEYTFHRALSEYPKWRTRRGEDVPALRASQGREARRRLDEALARRGASIDRLGEGGPAVLMASIDEALGSMFETYTPLFPDAEKGNEQASYAKIKAAFGLYIGAGGQNPPGGVRLPVSPFDPRWARRETVLNHGTEMMSIVDEDVRHELGDQQAGYDRLHRLAPQGAFALYALNPEDGQHQPAEIGASITEADVTGLSALRPFMSAAEYRELAPWVLAGAREKGPMGPAALERSLAILEHLGESGTNYRMVKDRNPGQIAASIVGTKAAVRIADVAPNDVWVGRVYDDGIATYYSDKKGKGAAIYEASPAEAVSLLRFALGERVERLDGQGTVGVVGARDRTQPRQRQRSYHVGSKNEAMLETRDGLWIRRDAKVVSQRTTWFEGPDAAEVYLRAAVASAAEGVTAAIDVEGLIEEAAANIGDPNHVPDFSGAPEEIVALKQDYWRLLTDPDSGVLLLNPGASAADYASAIAAGDHAAAAAATSAMDAGPYPQDKIRAHAHLVAQSMIGSFEADSEGLRFDPVRVAQFMATEHNVWRNNDDIVEACAKAGIVADELRGDGYYNKMVADNLISFDPATAVEVSEHPSPLMRAMGERVKAAIERGAAEVTSVQVDDNGIIAWQAERRVGEDDNRSLGATGEEANRKKRYVRGTIGQVLDRGPNNEVVTKFAGGDNFLFMPGFEASVVSQKPGENLTLEQRTRVKGYEQVLGETIESIIAKDIANPRSEVGRATSLNSTIRRLASNRHPVDFYERSAEEGLSDQWRDAILSTEARRVRYPTELAKGSNALKHRQAQNDPTFDELNDNGRDPLILTGMRNMSVLDRDAGHGIFDPMMTGMAENQGVVRYLTPGVAITADGAIVPSPTPEARVPIAAHEDAWAMGFDPHDRQNMTYSNVMQASAVVAGVKTAMAQIGGWNFEDGIVVSRHFAEEHLIRDTTGQMRPLTVGDKLSDFHGNKGVISLIVDRDMDADQARELGLSEQVAMFAANPELEVVMSPFSPISRFNGGTAREMIAAASDLQAPGDDGRMQTVPAGMGELSLIVTHMAVDAKTNVYDAEAMAQGKGRKASSQLAWALQSQGAYEVMRQFYGDNTSGLADVREYMLVLGLDVEHDGSLRSQPTPQTLAERTLFEIPAPIRFARSKTLPEDQLPRINHAAMGEAFGEAISRSGGLMELPFELKLAAGGATPASPANPGRWVLPVLSSRLRSEQDMVDGTVSRHDHTKRYMSISESATAFVEAQRLRDEAREKGDAAAEARHNEEMTVRQAEAQRSYNSISADVISRRIESKKNMFKESIMSNRLSHSATAVWTGDPRLEVDQIAMNSAMAVELGVPMMTREDAEEAGVPYVPGTPRDDGYVLVWRDPVLRDGGVRYLRVSIDDSLTGVAVNPVSVKSMDGDFDGDSVGLVGNLSPFAHFEALDKLTVEANLLDKGARTTIGVWERDAQGEMQRVGEREVYPLSLHTSLDIEVACHNNPERRADLEGLIGEANDNEYARRAGTMSAEEFCDANRAVMAALSESIYGEGFTDTANRVVLRFGDLSDHLESVKACYTRGGKGSVNKLLEYAQYLGAEPESVTEVSGERIVTQWRDAGMPDAAAFDEKYRGSQAATAFKSQITGIAGSISQSAIQLARAQGLITAACEISYPATQSVLQAKHDPVDAAYRADIISGAAKDLWRGNKMTVAPDENGRHRWDVVRDDQGQPVQATSKEWTEQFMSMYADKAGMGVPIAREHVEAMAAALSDSTGTMFQTDRQSWEDWPDYARPLTLDALAYGGKFDDVLAAAEAGGKLFEGVNASFAPTTVLDNLALDEQLRATGIDRSDSIEYTAIGRTDTYAAHRPKLRRSEWTARTRSASMGSSSRPDPFEKAPASRPAREAERVSLPAVAAADTSVRAPATAANQAGDRGAPTAAWNRLAAEAQALVRAADRTSESEGLGA
ncbi:hypothetical protein [Gordonia sp. GAMMA]|uniref:hypothetical protein n=1 Tax=Gordonia sp. GAMMA TaxID=2502241 RepID=UPI0014852673|nr:hypothetical protein [Gordonia sp. GAMMA]